MSCRDPGVGTQKAADGRAGVGHHGNAPVNQGPSPHTRRAFAIAAAAHERTMCRFEVILGRAHVKVRAQPRKRNDLQTGLQCSLRTSAACRQAGTGRPTSHHAPSSCMKVRGRQVKSGGYLSRAPAAPPQSSCASPLPAAWLPNPGGTSQAGWRLQTQSWSAEG